MKTTLIILTRNEIEGVKAIVPRIPREAVDEIFAVDYRSTDGTVEFFKEQNIRVVPQEKPGRGEAFRLAMQIAEGDALIFFSPDGNENPNDIVKFRPLLEEGYDIVIASRMMKGAHNEEDDQLLRLRKWANQLFGLVANIFWNRSGRYVTDTINGYRAVTKRAWEKLQPDGEGFTIEYQSSIRAFKYRMRIAEFPTHEGSRIGGKSGARAIPTGLKFILCFLRELYRRRAVA